MAKVDTKPKTIPCKTCGTQWYYLVDAEICCVDKDFMVPPTALDFKNLKLCTTCGKPEKFCLCCPFCGGDNKLNCTCPNSMNLAEAHSQQAAEIAVKLGIQAARPLHENISDYYLLEHLWRINGYARAGKVLRKMAAHLAPEFAAYLDMALGGEMRHGHAGAAGVTLEPYTSDRTAMWEAWIEWKTPLARVRVAQKMCYQGWKKSKTGVVKYDSDGDPLPTGWERDDNKERCFSSGFGGPKWGSIADALELYLTKKVSKVGFLDRVWNLQHNGGIALNKMYLFTWGNHNTKRLNNILNAHAQSDYELLLEHCTPAVRSMWDVIQFLTDCGHTEYLRLFNGEDVSVLQLNLGEPNDSLRRLDKWQNYSGSLRGQVKWQAHFTSE